MKLPGKPWQDLKQVFKNGLREQRMETSLVLLLLDSKAGLNLHGLNFSVASRECAGFLTSLTSCGAYSKGVSMRLENCQQSHIKNGIRFCITHGIL